MKPADKAPGGGRGKRDGKRRTARCALCGKPVVESFRPFCSKRCAEIDLGRWLKGAYSVPGTSGEMSDTSSRED